MPRSRAPEQALIPGTRTLGLLCAAWVTSACTGLVAGPESSTQTPVPASRDSAYVRAHRAVVTEAFTLDVVDSTGGRLVGTRFPSSSARLGSAASCRVRLAMAIGGNEQQAEVEATSRWLAPEGMSDKAPQVCEQERADVLERIAQTLTPPPTQ
jgi:hypothetical protein